MLIVAIAFRIAGNALICGVGYSSPHAFNVYTAGMLVTALGYQTSPLLRSLISTSSSVHEQALGLGAAASLEITTDLLSPLLGYVFQWTSTQGHPSLVYIAIVTAWVVCLVCAVSWQCQGHSALPAVPAVPAKPRDRAAGVGA